MPNDIYEKRIEIPADCKVALQEKTITVEGPKGKLERTFPEPYAHLRIENNEVVASTDLARKRARALVGTMIAHVRNMLVGVEHGYEYQMKIVFSHFPMSVELKERNVLIKNLIGERGIRKAKMIGDVEIKITEDDVIISGINLEHVSQTAANIQNATRLRSKDRRVFLDGIYVLKKRKGETVKSVV